MALPGPNPFCRGCVRSAASHRIAWRPPPYRGLTIDRGQKDGSWPEGPSWAIFSEYCRQRAQRSGCENQLPFRRNGPVAKITLSRDSWDDSWTLVVVACWIFHLFPWWTVRWQCGEKSQLKKKLFAFSGYNSFIIKRQELTDLHVSSDSRNRLLSKKSN